MPERIAVIIPCYNHAQYVGGALESVLSQTRPADRIIVVDDGSSDSSVEVLRAFEGRGVEVHAQENQGAHNTINRLVQMASTDCDFISILNSDDFYGPERLEKCLALAQKEPRKSVFCSSLRVMDGNSVVMPEEAPRSRWFHGAWSLGQQEGISIAEWLGQANFIATTSNVFARAAYLKANPFRPYRFNHDYFFLSTAALEDQIAVIPDILVDYRVHGSNTITTRPEPLMKEMIRLHLDLYRHHAPALLKNSAMRKRFFGFARTSWDSISSFHAGMLQVALAQLVSKSSEDELESLAAGLTGPEFAEFPNSSLASSYDGNIPLSANGSLGRRFDDLKEKHARIRVERDALDTLSRFRHKMLRSKWFRLGLILGLVHPLVSNRGKKAHEKMLWLRDACQGSLWLKFGEFIGSKSSHDLRRGQV